MKRGQVWKLGKVVAATVALALVLTAPGLIQAAPTAEATARFDSYISGAEVRLAQEHGSTNEFLAPVDAGRLRRGEFVIEGLTPATGAELKGALLHDWRGTAFAKGATVADFERVMKDFGAYPKRFSPQVLRAQILAQQGDHDQVTMRVRQHHILTVVLDITYDATFARLDANHGYSISRSKRVAEITASGSTHERALAPNEDHGFLWRINTYWSYEERDGGLYIQIESISLTRSVPVGLGWAIEPFIQSIPRESLEFTLRSACNALRR
jgi:hypothetical protein